MRGVTGLLVTLSLLAVPPGMPACPGEEDPDALWITHRVVLSPDLKTIVRGKVHEVHRSSSWLLVHDALKNSERLKIKYTTVIRDISFTADSSKFLTTHDASGVLVFDTATGKKLQEIRFPEAGWVVSASLSPDGAFVASANTKGVLRLSKVASGKELWVKKAPTTWGAVRVSPKGSRIAWLHAKGVGLYDPDGKSLALLDAPDGCGPALAFSPDEKLLAASDLKGTLRVWDLRKNRLAWTLKGHAARVYSLAFSKHGRRLASGSSDGTVRLWSLESGTCTRTITPTERRTVGSLAFADDGESLLGADYRGSCHRWAIETAKDTTETVGQGDNP